MRSKYVKTWMIGVAFVTAATLTVAGQTTPPATAAPPAPQAPAAQTVTGPAAPPTKIDLIAGRSVVLNTDFDITRISLTDDAIADGIVLNPPTGAPRQVLLNGKAPGTISMFLWGGTAYREYVLVVEPAVTTLEQKLHELFPGEDIEVSVSQGAVILSGKVSSNDVMLRAAEIASATTPGHSVINMLQLPGGQVSQQVMLQVRFAEVNRTAIEDLGVNPIVNRSNVAMASTTEAYQQPTIANDTTTFSDLLNVFFFQKNQGIGAVLKALQQHGDIESLAEPNLIAYNGKEASFLAGGEFPIPLVGGNGAVTVAFREFGIKLKFTPTIAGDQIRLHVRPEVSTLDFPNGVTINGFRIPALTERYAETEVELRDGQSFAIAGLLNHVGQENHQNIPFLSQIPIIGPIFKSRQKNDARTELLVLITPRLVRPLNPDEVPPLPTLKPPTRGGGGGDAGQTGTGRKGGGGLVDAPSGVTKGGR